MLKAVRCAVLFAVTLLPAAFAETPQVVLRSQALAAAEIESVPTLDDTRVYRLRVDLDSRKLVPGALVEYEVLRADGEAVAGGIFTASSGMINADGDTLTVLTGFGGLELSPRHQVVVKLVDPLTSRQPGGDVRRIAEPQIVDTCTLFCDRCSEKAGTLCANGVETYSCSCSGEDRSCSFKCNSRPPV